MIRTAATPLAARPPSVSSATPTSARTIGTIVRRDRVRSTAGDPGTSAPPAARTGRRAATVRGATSRAGAWALRGTAPRARRVSDPACDTGGRAPAPKDANGVTPGSTSGWGAARSCRAAAGLDARRTTSSPAAAGVASTAAIADGTELAAPTGAVASADETAARTPSTDAAAPVAGGSWAVGRFTGGETGADG